MFRGKRSPRGRPVAVWLLVTAGAVACWVGVGATARSLAADTAWHGTFEDLLVAVASAALVFSACWLWLVTTLTVADLIRGRESSGRGLTRCLVLAACGVAVAAGVSSPALAGGGTSEPVLAGLPLPDRAVASAPARPAPTPTTVTAPAPAPAPAVRATPPAARDHRAMVIVRPGDSLWSIAQADLGADAGLREIDDRWRELYAANRDDLGADPDLITPGQQLHLLGSTDPAPETDR